MADEDKKDDPEIWLWVMGIILLVGVLSRAAVGLTGGGSGEGGEVGVDGSVQGASWFKRLFNFIGGDPSGVFQGFQDWLINFSVFESLPAYVVFSAIASILALFVIIYSSIRFAQILTQWNDDIGYDGGDKYEVDLEESGSGEMVDPRNERWVHIEELAKSESENDWRQAILEADILLDEMVTHIGYRGENLGEKMKTIEKADFQTLDYAWEAHKVRNRIAHDGSGYPLSREEFLKVLANYQAVFEEFRFI